jgi:hypothetical protein
MQRRNFTVGSILGALTTAGVAWKIYGYTTSPLTKLDFPDTAAVPATNFAHYTDFQTDAQNANFATSRSRPGGRSESFLGAGR